MIDRQLNDISLTSQERRAVLEFFLLPQSPIPLALSALPLDEPDRQTEPSPSKGNQRSLS